MLEVLPLKVHSILRPFESTLKKRGILSLPEYSIPPFGRGRTRAIIQLLDRLRESVKLQTKLDIILVTSGIPKPSNTLESSRALPATLYAQTK